MQDLTAQGNLCGVRKSESHLSDKIKRVKLQRNLTLFCIMNRLLFVSLSAVLFLLTQQQLLLLQQVLQVPQPLEQLF